MFQKFCLFGPHASTGVTLPVEHLIAENEAGRPWVVKFVDNPGRAFEAATIAARYPHINNKIVLRFVQPWVRINPDWTDNDVMAHKYNPVESGRHIAEGIHRSALLEPGFGDVSIRKHVYIQNLCESRGRPDQDDPNWNNMHPVAHQAIGSIAAGEYLLERGWNLCAFGFNAGEPEANPFEWDGVQYDSAWMLPEMLQFLQWASNQNGRVVVGMNESVQDVHGVGLHWSEPNAVQQCVPFTFASQQPMIDALATLGLPPLETFVTEWAYSYRDFHSKEQFPLVLEHFDYLSPIYDQLRVVAVFIWHQMGHGPASEKSSPFVTDVLPSYAQRTSRVYESEPWQLVLNPVKENNMSDLQKIAIAVADAHPSKVGVIETDYLPALDASIQNAGEIAASSEIRFVANDTDYIVKIGRKPEVRTDDDDTYHVVKVGDWDNVQQLKKA